MRTGPIIGRLRHAGERLRARGRSRFGAPPVHRLRVLDHELTVPGAAAASTLRREVVLQRVYDRFSPSVSFRRIIDCGANVGAATSFFLQVHPQSHVTCFEPDPVSFSYLRENLRRNDVGHRVDLVNAAVSDGARRMEFFASVPGEGYSLRMSLDPDRRTDAGRSITVDAVSLGPYLERPVDLLKLDIEGAEFAVLDDLARRGDLDNVANLIVEVHHYPRLPGRLGRLIDTLEASGYGVVVTSDVTRGTGANRCQDILVTGSRRPELIVR